MDSKVQPGNKYNMLTTLVRSNKRKASNGVYYWVFRCDCGKLHEAISWQVINNQVQSCGCLRRNQMRTHGKTGTREYRSWSLMRQRCNSKTNPAYKDYGGRGITVCSRWNKFANFLSDMGECPPGMTLERIDVNKGYRPTNCCWASKSAQARNRRNSVYITVKGETMLLIDYAKKLQLTYGCVYQRLWKQGLVGKEHCQ